MTEQGAISELSAHADQLESMLFYYEENSPGRNNGAIESYKQAVQIAISALEEIQQYRKIGTVEECREAVERQRAKKPEHFYKKYGKHKWKRTEAGEIDEFAFDADWHSGVVCETCGKAVCTMCEPNYDELEDCEEEYWTCPNCGRKFYGKIKYCSCGQHLCWDDNP